MNRSTATVAQSAAQTKKAHTFEADGTLRLQAIYLFRPG